MANPENQRDLWLALAVLLSNDLDDEQSAAVFRAITGLSVTDPDADRAELERRVAEAQKLRQDSAGAPPRLSETDLPAGWVERERSCGCATIRTGERTEFVPCGDHLPPY